MSERFAERIAEHKRRDRLLEGGEPGFDERGLVPLFPVGDIEAMEDFGVEENAFAEIPVGGDGGEKARFERPVELFRRIDEMPMRKRETRRREMGRDP